MLELNYKSTSDNYGDIWEAITDIASSAASVTGAYLQVKAIDQQRKTAEAAARAAAAQQAAMQQAAAQQATFIGGPSISAYIPYILIGIGAFALIMILKRKKEPIYHMPQMYYPSQYITEKEIAGGKKNEA